MDNKLQLLQGEIVFSSGNATNAVKIHREVKAGRLRRIAPRIYTGNMSDSDKDIVRRNIFDILGHYYPGAVVSFRSAFDFKPTPKGNFFLTYKYNNKVSLPGITVHLKKGPAAQPEDMPFVNGLYLSSEARRFLENAADARGADKKTMTQEKLEESLDKICEIQGGNRLNQLRDEARTLSERFGWERAYGKLDRIIGAILKTREDSILKSSAAKARAKGYDASRIELFAEFCGFLANEPAPVKTVSALSGTLLRNLAFYESYFSNFIEGTTFELGEAKEIIFQEKLPAERPKDAHDIVGTFRILSNQNEMIICPATGEELIQLLQRRHLMMMQHRPEAMPGIFKSEPNKAGNTGFVSPKLVQGTLMRGFEYYTAAKPGLPRAAFMMFLVSEVHPFKDGNGRLARVMMNAELDRAGEQRIIIPTVCREDYLSSLRTLSRRKEPGAYVRMMATAQRFTGLVNFSDLDSAEEQLKSMNAFLEPNEGKLKLPAETENP